ncbi:MAG: flagellar basal body rod protein FlgB [Pseudomonadota bacterium]
MRFDLDKTFHLHEQSLYLGARRTALIASNLANVDTPHYKARDVDFFSVMRSVQRQDNAEQTTLTDARHMQPGGGSALEAEALYRHPYQANIDENTVEADVEKAKFAETAVHYQTTLTFLGDKIQGMLRALKGQS